MRWSFLALVSFALVASACVNANPTGAGGPLGVDEDVGRAPVLSPLSDVDGAATAARVCNPQPLPTGFAVGNDLAQATLRVSQAVYVCADDVTVASSSPGDLVAGSAHAAVTGSALLVSNGPPSPNLIAEIERLEPDTVVVFGVASEQVGERGDELLVGQGGEILGAGHAIPPWVAWSIISCGSQADPPPRQEGAEGLLA